MPPSKLPDNAHAGQIASFYYGAEESFRVIRNAKAAQFNSAWATLNVLIGGVPGYTPILELGKIVPLQKGVISERRFLHTIMWWNLIKDGIPPEDKSEAELLYSTAKIEWNKLQTFIKYNHGPRIKVVRRKIQGALKDAEEDTTWDNHNADAFEAVGGKLKYKKPKTSEASIIVGAKRWLKQNPEHAEDSPEVEAIREALLEAKIEAHKKNYWKPNLDEILAGIPLPDLPDPPEDWTDASWAETDPNNQLTVAPSLLTTSVGIQTRQFSTFLVKDMGTVDALTDFQHLVASLMSSGSSSFSNYVFWAVSKDNSDDILNMSFGGGTTDSLVLRGRENAGQYQLILTQVFNGSSSSDVMNLSFDTRYDWTIDRNGGALDAEAFTDINRTISAGVLSVTLDEPTETFQYVSAFSSWNSGAGAAIRFFGDIYDMDLQAVVVAGVGPLINGGLINTGLTRGGLLN